jgi:DNA-binding NtrC family response regulator
MNQRRVQEMPLISGASAVINKKMTFSHEGEPMPKDNLDRQDFSSGPEEDGAPGQAGMEIRVLLVEDDSVDSIWVQSQLSAYPDAKFHFTLASRLEQALEQMDSGFFDAILLDLNLPDSHGGETLLRTMMHSSRIPVIVLSGNRSQRLSESARDRGVYAYLIKDAGAISSLPQSLHEAVLERQAVQAERRSLVQHLDDEYGIYQRRRGDNVGGEGG